MHDNRLGQLAAHADRHGQRGLDETGAHVLIDVPADYTVGAFGVSGRAGGRGCLDCASRVLTAWGGAVAGRSLRWVRSLFSTCRPECTHALLGGIKDYKFGIAFT